MSLRIAFDLDGTIADMEGALQREAETLYGPNVQLRPSVGEHLDAPASVDEVPDDPAKDTSRVEKKAVLRGRKLRQLWEHVAGIEDFWTSLREIEPGAVARIGAMRDAHKLEVIFLTQRPETEGEITQLQTQRWLEAHGFELPSVFVLQGSRGLAASALQLDVVVDDRPENCLEVATESKALALLVWRDPMELLPPGATRRAIEPVSSVVEALHRIEAIISNPSPESSVVSRLRRAMGL